MYRFLYNCMNWEYIGSYERNQIDRAKYLKDLSVKQLKVSRLRLRSVIVNDHKKFAKYINVKKFRERQRRSLTKVNK